MTNDGHDNRGDGTYDSHTAENLPSGNYRPLEVDWEHLALDELVELDWPKAEGNELAPGSGHRASWDDLVLYTDLRDAIERLNPDLPPDAVRDALATAATPASQDAYEENRTAHGFLTAGIRSVTYTDSFGAEHNPTVRVIDLTDPDANTYRAVRQVIVIDGEKNRRFDLVLYINGLPLAVIELKRAGDESATLESAHAQISRYVEEFPTAFRYNALVLLSDGITAKYGTPFTPYEHFAPWNTDEFGARVDPLRGEGIVDSAQNLALHGLFTQPRFLSLIGSFINFVPSKKTKRIAKPHQYFAVTRAADKVRQAAASDGKAGVVWHTQGSGKSEEMVLTSNLVSRDPALHNPTIVVITDRNDLDDQLYGTFLESEVLPEKPQQVLTRAQLREELAAKRTGGILFTTLQKFGKTKEEKESGTDHPLLSDRRNIIVIVDEAHRSHYDNLDGYARHLRDALPHATLLAFTGTPISESDRDTREVFGDYIDVYDLKRAADDGATVKVYHESRVVQLVLDRDVDPTSIDEEADRITDGLDDSERSRIEQAVATMNALYGAPARIRDLTRDLVEHWEARRTRMQPFVGVSESGGAPGKAMIVCATRDICAQVYDELRTLRPEWHSDDIDKGAMKIVFSFNSRQDKDHLKPHALRDSQRKAVINRAKDPDDELELLIVHSMLLTGFDAPPIHTMYLDRPLKGANLMQALARVNRRYRMKEDGLLVGYAPLTENLQRAIAEYSESDQKDRTLGQDIDRALEELRNEYNILDEMLHGWDWRERLARPTRTAFIDAALGTANYLRSPQTPGNNPEELDNPEETLARRFRNHAHRLERFFALAGSSADIGACFEDQPYWKRDIQFFVEVRAYMAKLDAMEREARGLPISRDVQLYLSQLTSAVVETGGVTDLFAEAGLETADLTYLNDALVAKLQSSETPHLAAEALRRLVEQKMREVTRHNIVRQTAFSDRLQELMVRYMRQQLTSAEIIAKLVEMAKEIANDARRGEQFTPALDNNELAFYDAVADLGSARELMGDETLAEIARELVVQIRQQLKPDWISREPVRAKLRTTIKRLLARRGYPPKQAPAAIELVLKQMEHFANEWSTEGTAAR
ncbi:MULTISPECIES: type I restriction endonuclease subunit R [unclassified Streptomyces]|uniref:type I restriction endonuclease subunit R n=1 Tax=unclassified Streptomyces TaxID=2593676 RepID=UPI002E81453C|nr:type I restriction endonuclease subunit R [Streptomyces sp. NBC_00589]WTI39634.1 type I restriction endonuclease subunit R [Streptomyces sp. NBC_00775]WUB26687.1 type I restriction endonuclease subunit R [Streptomyces sp. NBC_00589]